MQTLRLFRMCRQKARMGQVKLKTAVAKVVVTRRSQHVRTALDIKMSTLATYPEGRACLHLRQEASGLLAAPTLMMTTKEHLYQNLRVILRKQSHLVNQHRRKGEATEQSAVDRLARLSHLKMTKTSRAEVGAEVCRRGRALGFPCRTGPVVPAKATETLKART